MSKSAKLQMIYYIVP